jgi:predicted nuclease of predicted toxin-antitoxin system
VPRSPVTLFIDRSLGKRKLLEALSSAGASAVHHDDLFPQFTPDEVWIQDIAQRGWGILTNDRQIKRRPMERLAVQESGAKLFTLTCKHVDGNTIASVFVRHLEKILNITANEKGPFIYSVTQTRLIRQRLAQ